MPARSFKLNLNAMSSENLRLVAANLGVTESEVIRKGLLLISLYEKLLRTPGCVMVLREPGQPDRELMI